MASENNYSIEMIWSPEDGLYLSQVRELPGCVADGSTPEEAFQNIRIVMREWLETATEEGREIPAPITLDVLEQNARIARNALEKQLEERVREVVGQVLQNMTAQQTTQNIPSWRQSGFTRFDDNLEKAR
jgi:predicted RNase H-like HicB family nuclease